MNIRLVRESEHAMYEQNYMHHTRLSLGGEWHDGYAIYEDASRSRLIDLGLTMEGCLSLQQEHDALASGEYGEIYDTLSFDDRTRTWHLTDAEYGEVEVDEPFVVNGIELWNIGDKIGYGWDVAD